MLSNIQRIKVKTDKEGQESVKYYTILNDLLLVFSKLMPVSNPEPFNWGLAKMYIVHAENLIEKLPKYSNTTSDTKILNTLSKLYQKMAFFYKFAEVNSEKALKYFLIAFQIENKNTELLREIIKAYIKLENFKEALNYINSTKQEDKLKILDLEAIFNINEGCKLIDLAFNLNLNNQFNDHDLDLHNSRVLMYIAKGEYENALEIGLKSLEISKSLYNEINSSTATCLNNLGIIYLKLNKIHEAEQFINEALKIRLDLYKDINSNLINLPTDQLIIYPINSKVANSLENKALTYIKIGKINAGLAYQKIALNIKEQLNDTGSYTLSIANSKNNIGLIYLNYSKDIIDN